METDDTKPLTRGEFRKALGAANGEFLKSWPGTDSKMIAAMLATIPAPEPEQPVCREWVCPHHGSAEDCLRYRPEGCESVPLARRLCRCGLRHDEHPKPEQQAATPAAYGECGEAAEHLPGSDGTPWGDGGMDRTGSSTQTVVTPASGLGPVPELMWLGIAASTASRSSATDVRDYAIKAKARVEELERLLLASQTTVTQWAVKHDKAEAALAAANAKLAGVREDERQRCVVLLRGGGRKL